MGRLGKAEVAKRIGVEVRKLEYMVDDEEFPAGVKIGKSVWWLEEVVDAWLDLAFAAQKDWVCRAREKLARSGESDGLAVAAPPSPGPAVAEKSDRGSENGKKQISTALRCAAVPAPARLV